MAYKDAPPASLKRKRGRRRADKPFISGHLHLDSRLKGDIALLSDDLIEDLFPTAAPDPLDKYHVAVTAWTTASTLSAASTRWIILPCTRLPRGHPELPHSSLRLSIHSPSAQALQSLGAERTFRPGAAIEIRIADVVPLALDTVFVTLNPSALGHKQLDSTLNTAANRPQLGDGFKQKEPVVAPIASAEDAVQMVKEAFPHLIRAGDSVSAVSMSATITACEPVSQGLVTAATRVVVVSHNSRVHRRPKPTPVSPAPLDGEEETSNQAFYNAPEHASVTAADHDDDAASDSHDSALESDADLSDDFDDMISLSSPAIASQASGNMSTLTAATPRPFGRQPTGISTPGSVFSSVTSATARGPKGGRVKTFRTQGLLERVPDDLLHPKPSSQDDEESRVFVETSALGKLGCFSGDWVRLEEGQDPSMSNSLSLGLARFRDQGAIENDAWRPARIYALPDLLSPKPPPRYLLGAKPGRRDSISSSQAVPSAPATMYLSPILLANMGEPVHIRVSPLRSGEMSSSSRSLHLNSRLTSSSTPPIAKEVSFFQVSTPLSMELPIQPSLFIGLRDYFEQKQRLVKNGDLFAIAIDEQLGRAIFAGGAADEENTNNDLLSQLPLTDSEMPTNVRSKGTAVAWFQIRDVTPPSVSEGQEHEDWGGVVVVDPSRTRMGQSRRGQRRLPATTTSVWPFYEGVCKSPAVTDNSRFASRVPPKPYVSQLQRRLRELMLAAMSPRATHLGLPPLAILLTSTQRNIGKAHTVSRACLDLGLHFFPIDAYDTLSEGGAGGGGDNKTEVLLKMRAERALTCGAQNTTILIRHIDALSSDRMASALKDILADCRVLIATSTEVEKIPDNIRALFTQELEMTAPDEGEREGILRSVIADSGAAVSLSVDLSSIAVKTAALVAGDLVDVTERALLNQTARLESLAATASATSGSQITLRDIQLSGGDSVMSLTPADFDQAVDDARKNFADAIGAPKIPNVQWSDVGGLANVKDAIIETIQLPLSRPELFAKGLKKRSGILFYGPPGTGKTLLAKAVATEFSLNFFSVKGPELLNMYIGESEANVRRVFQRARDARPCCVFFDELDSVAPKRGNQGDSGGVMDRIVSQLLAELDGMSDGDDGGGGVFVIGATNRPDLLDQALLRPGRFDKMLYLGVSDTHEKQQNILQALTRKFTLAPDMNLQRVAERLPFTYTGADFYALCSDAMLKAITRSARLVDERVAEINKERAAETPPKPAISIAYFFDHYATDKYTQVVVAEEDFYGAQRELVPSVSAEELNHYERVRKEFEGGKEREKDKGAGVGVDDDANAPNGMATRAQLAEMLRQQMMMQRANSSLESQQRREGVGSSNSNGGTNHGSQHVNGKSHASADAAPAPPRLTHIDGDGKGGAAAATATDEDEDEYIIRTDQLSLNGSGSNNPSAAAAAAEMKMAAGNSIAKNAKAKAKQQLPRSKGKGKAKSASAAAAAAAAAVEEKEKEDHAVLALLQQQQQETNAEFGDAAAADDMYT